MAREDRGEVLVPFAIQQYGAALGWHYLKNQVEDLSLQFVEIADGMYGSTDLEQCVQVARDTGTRRKLLENSIRLQVEHILWTKLRARLGQTVFVLYPAGSRFL